MPVIPNLNLIFIHIPKTGGSSINEFFNLSNIREQGSITGKFLCERKLPGHVRGTYGKDIVYTTHNLKTMLSKGDFIRIGRFLYQVHSDKALKSNKIHLACVDDADAIMKGNLAKKDAIFLGGNGKMPIYKKLVSDIYGNKIIPSKFHWGWIVTKSRDQRPLKEVYGLGIVREKGLPALELDHVSLLYIRNRLTPKQYNNYFKFCFVRNPYDRIVSEYFWKIKDNDFRLGINCKSISFRDFVNLLSKKFDFLLQLPHNEVSHFLPQYLFVCDENDELLVDYVAKYEDGLESGLKKLFDAMRIPYNQDFKLPKNNTTRHKRKKFTEYYDEETKEIIYNLYKKDFDVFGYSKEFTD